MENEKIEQYANPRAMAMLVPDAARAAIKAARTAHEQTKQASARLLAAHSALLAHLKRCGAMSLGEPVRSPGGSVERWCIHGVEVQVELEWDAQGPGAVWERLAIKQFNGAQEWERLEDTGRILL